MLIIKKKKKESFMEVMIELLVTEQAFHVGKIEPPTQPSSAGNCGTTPMCQALHRVLSL